MGIFSPAGSAQITATNSLATLPTILNLSAALAETEYVVQLPTGTKQFQLRTRGNSQLEYAYSSFTPSTPTCIVPKYCSAAISNLLLDSPLDLYFRVSTPSQTVELHYWI